LPINPAIPVTRRAPTPEPATEARETIPVAADQLARDIAEIETARDAIIAAEGTGPFALTGRNIVGTRRLLRRQDVTPVLIGAMLAVFMLVVYGAVASIIAFGR
jgi:hypothetical protein